MSAIITNLNKLCTTRLVQGKWTKTTERESRGIHAVGNSHGELLEREKTCSRLNQNDVETVHIWSEEWQFHISGLALQKRDRSR